MDRLTSMRVFVEVAATGSQTAAAARLDMSRAMVTRYLAELESWLGERLMHRTTRHLSLTDAGQECLQRCRLVLEQVGDLENSAGLRNAQPKGLIRVTSVLSFGRLYLAPAVADFVARYPEVQVEMLLQDRTMNLVEERIDLAIRISNDLDPALFARKLAPCRSVICAAPDYLARHGTPQTLEELSQHNCLTYTHFSKSEWRFSREGQSASVQVSGNITANEASVLLEVALAGAGISMMPTYLVGPLIDSGALVVLFPEWQPLELGIYAVYASRRYIPLSVRAFLDFLAERLGPVAVWDQLTKSD